MLTIIARPAEAVDRGRIQDYIAANRLRTSKAVGLEHWINAALPPVTGIQRMSVDTLIDNTPAVVTYAHDLGDVPYVPLGGVYDDESDVVFVDARLLEKYPVVSLYRDNVPDSPGDPLTFFLLHEIGHRVLGHGQVRRSDAFGCGERSLLTRSKEDAADGFALRAMLSLADPGPVTFDDQRTTLTRLLELWSDIIDAGEVSPRGVLTSDAAHPEWIDRFGSLCDSLAAMTPLTNVKESARRCARAVAVAAQARVGELVVDHDVSRVAGSDTWYVGVGKGGEIDTASISIGELKYAQDGCGRRRTIGITASGLGGKSKWGFYAANPALFWAWGRAVFALDDQGYLLTSREKLGWQWTFVRNVLPDSTWSVSHAITDDKLQWVWVYASHIRYSDQPDSELIKVMAIHTGKDGVRVDVLGESRYPKVSYNGKLIHYSDSWMWADASDSTGLSYRMWLDPANPKDTVNIIRWKVGGEVFGWRVTGQGPLQPRLLAHWSGKILENEEEEMSCDGPCIPSEVTRCKSDGCLITSTTSEGGIAVRHSGVNGGPATEVTIPVEGWLHSMNYTPMFSEAVSDAYRMMTPIDGRHALAIAVPGSGVNLLDWDKGVVLFRDPLAMALYERPRQYGQLLLGAISHERFGLWTLSPR